MNLYNYLILFFECSLVSWVIDKLPSDIKDTYNNMIYIFYAKQIDEF